VSVAGAREAWAAIVNAGDATGFAYRCGKGKSEAQFFCFPAECKVWLENWEVPAQGSDKLRSCQDHDYLGVTISDDLTWGSWFKSVCGRGRGALSAALRAHAPGALPGAAKLLLVRRAEATLMWGAEFLLQSPDWPAWTTALNQIQAGWWKTVYGITDITASWFRVLVDAGEADRLSAKIVVRAVALVNRLATMREEELPRRVFEAAWQQAGDRARLISEAGAASTWVATVRTWMDELGFGLVRDECPGVGDQPETSRGRLARYMHNTVWPAVRKREAELWWQAEESKPKHSIFMSWAPAPVGLEALWSEVVESTPDKGEFAWAAFQAWVQLRVTGCLAGGRVVGQVLPCALCRARGAEGGHLETGRHLLTECEATRPQLAEAAIRIGFTQARESMEWAILGGDLPAPALAEAIKLIGRIAARVRRARPAAQKLQEDQAFQEWLMATGVLPIVMGKTEWVSPSTLAEH
jgi:hypothetical protein